MSAGISLLAECFVPEHATANDGKILFCCFFRSAAVEITNGPDATLSVRGGVMGAVQRERRL